VGEVWRFPHDEYRGRLPDEWRAECLGANATAPASGVNARLLRRVEVGKHMEVMKKVLEMHHEELKKLGVAVPERRRAPRPVKVRARSHGRDDVDARLAAA
jgi:hypothetical protein